MRISTILLLCISLFYSNSSILEATERPWTHFGLRPLGMGNAFVAVADDYNSIFYNPAGLARLKTWDFEILNLQLVLSAEARDLLSEVGDIKSSTDSIDLIENNSGENQYFAMGITPHFVMRNFGFAIGIESSASAIFHRDISVDIKAGAEVVVPIGMAMNFLDERLSVGINIKNRIVAFVDQTFSMDALDALGGSGENSLEDYIYSGKGIGADLGVLFTPTQTMEPTIGLSITDIAGTSFDSYSVAGGSLGTPPIVLPSVNLGLSIKPFSLGGSYVRAAVDMHSINLPYSFSKKLQGGVEYGLGDVLRVQAGLYKGYLTAGLQLDGGVVNFKFVTYAEELGSVAGHKSSRRYAIQLKLLI